jgi:hypothetical protein
MTELYPRHMKRACVWSGLPLMDTAVDRCAICGICETCCAVPLVDYTESAKRCQYCDPVAK